MNKDFVKDFLMDFKLSGGIVSCKLLNGDEERKLGFVEALEYIDNHEVSEFVSNEKGVRVDFVDSGERIVVRYEPAGATVAKALNSVNQVMFD